MTAPTENGPQPVPGHPGWARWRGKDGHPRAAAGLLRVQAHNDTVLLARIRRAEGNGMDEAAKDRPGQALPPVRAYQGAMHVPSQTGRRGMRDG